MVAKPEEYPGFYNPKLENLSDSTREVLEKYSNIPTDQVETHVIHVRDQAWKILPYPCIGQWRFLDLSIGTHPLYPTILSTLSTSPTSLYLDLGCCFGQDIRRLVHDGVPSSQCYGTDLRQPFIDLGYDLFRDKSTLQSTFFVGDIFDDTETGAKKHLLDSLHAKVSIISANSFFHLFNLPDQRSIARLIIQLLKPEPGSLLIGRQVGNETPGYGNETHTSGPSGNTPVIPPQLQVAHGSEQGPYRHSIETWKKLWEEIGEEFGGVKFDVQATATAFKDLPGLHTTDQSFKGGMRMQFSVRRL